MRWTTIERRVPGTAWQEQMALVRLWNAWRIYAVKVFRGRTLLSLSGTIDAMIVANNLGRPAPRVLPAVP